MEEHLYGLCSNELKCPNDAPLKTCVRCVRLRHTLCTTAVFCCWLMCAALLLCYFCGYGRYVSVIGCC